MNEVLVLSFVSTLIKVGKFLRDDDTKTPTCSSRHLTGIILSCLCYKIYPVATPVGYSPNSAWVCSISFLVNPEHTPAPPESIC